MELVYISWKYTGNLGYTLFVSIEVPIVFLMKVISNPEVIGYLYVLQQCLKHVQSLVFHIQFS